MSIRAEQIPPEPWLIHPGIPDHHQDAVQRGIRDFLGSLHHDRDRYPNLELWGVSVLLERHEFDGYEPVWVTTGEPSHPYEVTTWGSQAEEILYPIEDILAHIGPAIPRAETSHSHWRSA